MREGADPEAVAEPIRRWKHLQVFTRAQMEDILVAKLIATSAKQIGMFLVILAIVSAAIVAFIIYTMTLGKLREIAVLKLIGTRNRTIAGMILQQALGLGLIGFIVGKIAATLWAPVFPKYVLLQTRRRRDRLRRRDGDLRAGQHAGDPRGAEGGPGGGDRMNTVNPSMNRNGIRIEGLRKRLRRGRHRRRCAQKRQHDGGPRRGGRADRPLGLGQEHAAQMPGRHHRAQRRPHDAGAAT